MTQLVGALISVHNMVQDHKTSVIIPCVEGVSEAVARVYNRYGVFSAMRPHTTIRNLLLHPKDKVNTEETAELFLQDSV